MCLSVGRCRGVWHTPLSSGSLKKQKDGPSKRKKNIASPLSFTTCLCVSSKCLRLYLLSKYKQLKASGKWTLSSSTPESLRKKIKSLRRDEFASGKTAFSVGNIKKPQAKRHFQLETSNCLRQNGISSWKHQIALGKTAFPARNNDLPEALASRRRKHSFA